MLNGVNLRIKLSRAKNVCCPVSSAVGVNFKVAITEAILFVRTVKVASSTILGHAAALNTPAPSIPSAESIVKCSLLQEDLVVYPVLLQTPQFNSSGCGLCGRRTNSPRTFVPEFSRRWWSKCHGLLSKSFLWNWKVFPGYGQSDKQKWLWLWLHLIRIWFDPTSLPGRSFWAYIKQGNPGLELYFSEVRANTVNLVVYAESKRSLRLHKLKMDTIQLTLTLTLAVIYNRNQRTAWLRRRSTLRLFLFTEGTLISGLFR